MADDKKKAEAEGKDKKDAKAEATPEEQAAKSRKRRLLLLIVGGVLLAGGGGGAAAFFLSRGGDEGGKPAAEGEAPAEEAKKDEHAPAKEEHGKPEEEKEEHGKEAKGKEEHGKEAKGKEEHGKDAKKDAGKDKEKDKDKKLEGLNDFGCTHQFQPFNVNLGNPLENRFMRLELALEYGCGEEAKAEIERRMPQLRDAIIGVASKKTREFLLGPDGKAQLRKELQAKINQHMTRPINDVFITDILIE